MYKKEIENRGMIPWSKIQYYNKWIRSMTSSLLFLALWDWNITNGSQVNSNKAKLYSQIQLVRSPRSGKTVARLLIALIARNQKSW